MNESALETNIKKTALELIVMKSSDSDFPAVRTKLASLIWEWAQIKFGSHIENAGVEIMQCIDSSIKNYREESGSYLDYLFVSLKNAIRKIDSESIRKETYALHLPYAKQQKIRNIKKLAEDFKINIKSPETHGILSDMLGYPIEEIKNLLLYDDECKICGEFAKNSHGEEISIWDRVSSSPNENPESKLLQKEKIENYFAVIDETYKKEKDSTISQKKEKEYLGSLLTYTVCHELTGKNLVEHESLKNYLQQTSFFASEVFELYFKDSTCSQQDIARLFGKEKSDASRKIKKFCKNCQLAEKEYLFTDNDRTQEKS